MKVRLIEDVEILPGLEKKAGTVLTSSDNKKFGKWIEEGKAIPLNSELPDDFPKRKELLAKGLYTIDQVKSATDDELTGIEGIGPKSLNEIRNYN